MRHYGLAIVTAALVAVGEVCGGAVRGADQRKLTGDPPLNFVANNGEWKNNNNNIIQPRASGDPYPAKDTKIYPNNLLQECEGDCDGDDHCATGLFCFHRCPTQHVGEPGCTDSNVNSAVPGCSGDPEEENGQDYCANMTHPEILSQAPWLEYNKEDKLEDQGKLLECQGDCDSDSDCDLANYPDLKCFKRGRRNEYEAVPGCAGLGVRKKDYCYDSTR